MSFKENFKATIEEGIQDIDQKAVDLIEQSWLDSIYDVIKKRMKEAGGFKFNVGFGTFEVTPSVKQDNTNIAFDFSKEFKKIVEGEDDEIIVEDGDYIETFDLALTNYKIKTVPGLSAAMLGMIGEGIARDGRSHLAEDKWYVYEVPRIGSFKFGYIDGEVKINFEASKELKQLVKNYGI